MRPGQRLGLVVATGGAVLALTVVGCGDDGSPKDPGSPGGKTELDGGEADTGGGTTTTSTTIAGTGGSSGGATQGNQIGPGDTSPTTAQRTTG